MGSYVLAIESEKKGSQKQEKKFPKKLVKVSN